MFLLIDFLNNSDNLIVNCLERLVPIQTCTAAVSSVEVNTPNIKMLGVPLQTINENGRKSVETPSDEVLQTQFRQLHAMMPFPEQILTSPENISFRRLKCPEDFVPDSGSNFFAKTTDSNADIEDTDSRMVLDILSVFWIDVIDPNLILLGIVPSISEGSTRELAQNCNADTWVATWYTNDIDELPNDPASFFGGDRGARNLGSHKLGHVLQQRHAQRNEAHIDSGIAINDISIEVGFCGKKNYASDGNEQYTFGYDFAADLFPNQDDAPYPDDFFIDSEVRLWFV